ncbi:signal-transducing histidine kinase [Halorubrum californiense DSM 19288]|uniref:histidine kinase n=1 Tax=Halorubrum californiense DSM 19288 TaxID=1227465 RepID=M0ECR8_9EURY|nr:MULTISPECIES: HAMP domain-containing sensor histidine kinase [Halorubrum]ELZ44843.1 signal-transducing histidine kinase [Halorubrum californiense DSM 19288]TKX70720.1 HAMP domain-containing histidine kinase [Halorubrum sp. GN11GM_10-3_MGM]
MDEEEALEQRDDGRFGGGGDKAGPEERLKRQRDDLQLLNQVMRHDIRNDLQLVGAYAELLDEHVDEEGKEYLDVIKRNTQSAVSLTTTVRDLAEVMLRDDAEPSRVALDRVLSQKVEEVRSAYSEAVFTVEGSYPEVEVVGDEMLSSVFRNLLRNAVQHNDEVPPTVTVAATVDEDEGVAEVRVADNGPGIPEDQRDEIFGKGEKGLDSPGAGIGLYLVRSLVEIYGGDVWVEDNQPKGAVFVVRLPLCSE